LTIRRGQPRRDDDDDTQQPHREMVPGSLDHASGEVDEFEAGLVRGADGEAGGVDEAELERQATGAAGAVARRGSAGPATTAPGAPTTRGPARLAGFLRASWAELQRVQWPDRKQVGQGTAVTLGFVVVAGAFLGIADEVATRIVDLIL
jgi:preprotein translocase subunit SecE